MNKFNEAKPGSRVGEWAPYSYNIGSGCPNACKYCYARDMALTNKQITDKAQWTTERVKSHKVGIEEKADGMVMFPTMHDITENNLTTYKETLANILKAGNRVLIVSKPRLACIQSICDTFTGSTDQILFRFTIGSLNENVCAFWEPNAPKPKERIAALEHALDCGYETSVSAEPMLEGYKEAIGLYEALEPIITDTIWFGKMDDIDDRVDMSDPVDKSAAQFIRDFQSDANIRLLYDSLKDRSKVRWKKSIRQVLEI
jgi:DNA repair photolyase